MTGQHKPLWKPEAKSEALKVKHSVAHAAPVMMSHMSYLGSTTTILWHTNIISHCTTRECQMMVTIKTFFKRRSQSSVYGTLIEKPPT